MHKDEALTFSAAEVQLALSIQPVSSCESIRPSDDDDYDPRAEEYIGFATWRSTIWMRGDASCGTGRALAGLLLYMLAGIDECIEVSLLH